MPVKRGKLKLVSITEFAGIVGKTPRAVRMWIDAGMPVHTSATGKGGAHKLNAPDCIEWMLQREKGGDKGGPTRRYEEARAAKMESEARLTEIELERMRGSVVDVAAAIAIFADRIAAIRGSLQSMPARAAIAVAAETTRDGARAILEDEINAAMASVSTEFLEDDDGTSA